MPLDPKRLADTKAWLALAAEDLRAADFEFKAQPPLLADIVFHAQQLAEKTMKAFLTWHDVPFRKTHDLAELGLKCVTLDQSLDPLCRSAERLTIFAWVFRYPGDLVLPSQTESELALRVAREVNNAILKRLQEVVQS